jgi:YD repeat-containing protein
LSVVVGTQSSESYYYDSLKRLLSLTRTIGTRNYTTGYQHNEAGQLTQLTYPSGRAVNVNRDSIGRVSSLVNNADSSNYLSGLTFNWAGQMTGRTLGTNIVESYTYSSARLQLTRQLVTQNGFTRMDLNYDYQASAGQMGAQTTAGNAGQLMKVVNQGGTQSQINGLAESASYTYDNVGRLVTSDQISQGANAQRRFAYDRWGNRTGVWNAVTGGTQIQTVALDAPGGIPTNRIQSVNSVNHSYDSAGNLTNDGVTAMTPRTG